MNTIQLVAVTLLLVNSAVLAADPSGLRPLGADGQPLNLDFETGTLKDWTATGDAFAGQPVAGDTVAKRRTDMKSEHQGKFWISSFENPDGDKRQGTLTSVPFKAVQPWASFLVAGGSTPATKVEVFVKEGANERAIYRASGSESENLRRAVVNLTPYVGKEIFVRLTDKSGTAWGHVNFDDFLFHSAEPKFANAIVQTKQDETPPPPVDDVKFAGLPAEQAANEMTLPAGFKATLFAGEPDVVQPIAFCLDDRGRLWVAEGMTYPKRAPEGEGRDRILVFEDTDGDGKFNKRTIFMEKLNLISGLEVGFGGVWVGAAPNLMFIPVNDWDNPKPAGEPKILLDGWDFKRDTHETLNTFTWGPDGWLYGCHGVFCPSLVGKPGTPEKERQWVDAAVWRYHPTQHRFEIFSEGTSNPWGIDFDERGQCFIEACVIPHFWHIIQGARYLRQGGDHYCIDLAETARNERHREEKSRKPIFPYTYADIQAHGDHVHWAGSKGPHAANGRSDAAGGGHAHAGLLVYQGDSWPAEYRGKIFMNNIHGQRINMDVPVREGSGFVGKHGADFINFNDRWSQILNLLTGPDGSVFMIDWYDKNQCHHNDVNGHDRSNGRIFKISYGETKPFQRDLAKATNEELGELVVSGRNSWQVRHASRILLERVASGKLEGSVLLDAVHLTETIDWGKVFGAMAPVQQLRLLWLVGASGKLSNKAIDGFTKNQNEYVRAWTIQLACQDKKPSDELLKEFARLAKEDPSPVVRLYLASACQRLSVEQRLPILEALLAHEEDAKDHNLPLMYWYATEAVAAQGAAKAVPLLGKAKIPQIRQFITKRMTAASKQTAAAN